MPTLLHVDAELTAVLEKLDFGPPVTTVYNPLVYAHAPRRKFLERWGDGSKEIVFLGMNPGPWGMSQTGIPFGEVAAVRDWLGIEAPVERPENEHPKRPIEGFACERSEVSGRRLWGYFAETCGTPDRFFARAFVINYCPLAFMEEGGRNRTPDKLPIEERRPLEAACDEALRKSIEILRPQLVVGVGAFAERCAGRALEGCNVRIGRMLHPSPASPAANRGWAPQAARDLAELGVDLTE